MRRMTEADLKLALDWAAAEGWNPGLDDAHCFYAADPQGFFLGELDGARSAACRRSATARASASSASIS